MPLTSGENIIIIGGGLPGIFSALFTAKNYPDSNIILIESENVIGGLYNSINDAEGGIFDKGMHLYYETGNEEIDSIIRNCLKENDWHYLKDNYKDIAGVYYKGKLETKTPYLNINQVNKDNLNDCLSDFFLSLEHEAPSFKTCFNVREFLEKRFGYALTEELFEPVMKKLWRNHSSNLHATATRIVLMDRICIFSEETTKDLIKSNRMQSRVAYPDQMKLDLSYRNKQIGLYPKSFGMINLIKGMEKKLIDSGVIIHRSTDLKSINKEDNTIKSITLEKDGITYDIDSIKLLHWTISPLVLSKFLDINIQKGAYDQPLNQIYVFLLLCKKPKMDELYYFYSLEPGTKTFRVTNYSSYCPDAIRSENNKYPGTFPICIEMHYDTHIKNEEKVLSECISEIIKFGIISEANQIVFSRVEKAGGVPLLTLNNCNILAKIGESISDLGIGNLLVAGQAPDRGIFFLHDVLDFIYNKIKEFKNFNS